MYYMQPFAFDSFTPTETLIAKYILRGMSVKETSKAVGRTPGTVRKHRKNLFQKTGCDGSLDFFGLAFRQHAIGLMLCDDIPPARTITSHDRRAAKLMANYAA